MTNTIKGSCLCGEVSFSVDDSFTQFFLCHCQQCQKLTGSAHASNLFTAPDNLTWLSGQHLVQRFDHPSRDFSKVFCQQCGSGLPFLTKSKQALIVPAGALDHMPSNIRPEHIFWDERAPWYDVSSSADKHAGFSG